MKTPPDRRPEEHEDMIFSGNPEQEASAWLIDGQQDFPISEDFVDRTLAQVIEDQREIRAEARQVDEAQLPADALAELQTPKPTTDFVDRVLQSVVHERGERDAEERRLRTFLSNVSVPEVSQNFVERTLQAIAVVPSQPAALRSWRPLVAAAALLVLLPMALLLWQRENTSDEHIAHSATFTAAMAAQADVEQSVTPLAYGNELVHMLALAESR